MNSKQSSLSTCFLKRIFKFSGLDSSSIEHESYSDQPSVNQGFSSNQQISTGGLQISNKHDQVPVSSSSSSGRDNNQSNQAVIGGKPKPCPVANCASKGSVHRHIRYNAFFI